MSLVPVADQLARVLAEASALPERSLPLAAALGARLSRDVTTATAVPPWDNSAMDGYAVRHEDVADASPEHPVRLRVVADLPAGSPDDPRIGPGEAVRIMTGATLPSDADTIVQLEHTDRDDPLAPLAADVTVLRAPRRGEHVRRAGEDRQVGDPAASAGTLVTGAVAAALSSVGAGTVWVHERPRVAVLATGSEARHARDSPAAGPDPGLQLAAAARTGRGGGGRRRRRRARSGRSGTAAQDRRGPALAG